MRANWPYSDCRRRPHLAVRAGERPAISRRAGERDRAGGDLGVPAAPMTRRRRNASLVLSPIVALAWCSDAIAYRPFDGTDAAVAEPGQVEIEFGPAQYLQIGSERTLVAPSVVLNYGIADRWELVLQGEAVHSLMEDASKSSLVGNALFLK